jgi:hypothetical protein
MPITFYMQRLKQNDLFLLSNIRSMDELIRMDKQRTEMEIIEDSYRFLKQNFMEMMIKIIIFAGPPIFFAQALSHKFATGAEGSNQFLSIISLVILFFSQSIAHAAAYWYIVSHKNGGDNSNQSLWEFIQAKIMMFFSTYATNMAAVFIGFIALIIPGVLIMVPLSLIYIHRTENQGNYIDSAKFAFSLVKDRWWKCFWVLLAGNIAAFAVASPFIYIHYTYGLNVEEPSSSGSAVTSLALSVYYCVFTAISSVPCSMLYYSLKRDI